MNLKNQIKLLKGITLFTIILISISCKNKKDKEIESKYYEVTITDPNGITLPYTINKDGLLAGFIDSVQYGFTFSDGPNESVIAKLHRLDYTVNATIKSMNITNVITDIDTIQNQSSKKLNGGNNRLFDINVTKIIFKNNDNGWSECGQNGVCCSISQSNTIVCCGTCNPIPENCSGCGLKNPFPSASMPTSLTINNPDAVPTLNDIFRNYTTLTVKLK